MCAPRASEFEERRLYRKKDFGLQFFPCEIVHFWCTIVHSKVQADYNLLTTNHLMFLHFTKVLKGVENNFFVREARSPLARLLFQLEGVKGVFLTENFITVTIEDDSQWMQINNDVLGVVMDFYASGQSVLDSPQQGKFSRLKQSQ